MESADDVRANLAVAPLGDLRQHEATSPDGESRVADLLAAARVLSWPLVVDAASGLILDGSHRAGVLARDFGARFAVIQRVILDAGAGLAVDHRIPDRLFADEAGRHAYADALARAALTVPSRFANAARAAKS